MEHPAQPCLSAAESALARQKALTELALAALSGASPYRLGVDACELLSLHLATITSVESRGGRVGSATVVLMQSWFAVPIGRQVRYGQLVVGSATRRLFQRDEMLFVEAVADVLHRANAAHAETEFLRHQASHDTLTGLPNRAALAAKLRTVTADEVPVGVLLCDLDGLKLVNDRLGHQRGDELLIAIAGRIRSAVRPGDLVARIGGDEFVVVCPVVTLDEVEMIAQRIQAAAAEPIRMDRYEVTTSVSVGMALSDTPGDTAALIDQADAAMYRSKQQRGEGRWRQESAAAATGAMADAPADELVVDIFRGRGGATTGHLVEPGVG